MRNGKTVIAEVGVGHLTVAFGALHWDNEDYEILMFEPHPEYFAEVKEAAGDRKNVQIFNVAIGDENGETELYLRETSSYISEVNKVSTINQGHPELYSEEDRVRVKMAKFSEYDPGDIDCLRIDTEGSEWFTLKHLLSRPAIINIETHDSNASYINPYLWEIEEWMRANGYSKTNMSDMDSIYKQTGNVIPPVDKVEYPPREISFYKDLIGRFLNLTYYKHWVNRVPPDIFAVNLRKIYDQKSDVIERLATYLRDNMENHGREVNRVLSAFDMFILPMVRDIDRVNY